jgi:hypothetical protein
MMERVVNFHDGEDNKIYVETDDRLLYFINYDDWANIITPVDHEGVIVRATYMLHYTDHFTCMSEDNQ